MERKPSTSGGLQVPAVLGIKMSDLEAIQSKFTTLGHVDQELKSMGIVGGKQPDFPLPELTAAALTTTSSTEYTEMYAKQLAWSNYLGPVLADVSSGLLEAENQMTLIEAKIKEVAKEQNKARAKEDRVSDVDIKNQVLNDPIYQEAMLEAQRLKQFKLKLEAMHEIAGRNLRLVSRQVTIRGQDIEAGLHDAPSVYGSRGVHRPIGGMR